jgi:predicted transcriptional regulator/DNA-binding XRE family transcriptional regulator
MGGKVRSLRRKEGLTQAQLAGDLGISTSYLNLIENNRRPLTAPLLIKLARRFSVDLDAFGEEDEARLVAALREILGDNLFAAHDVSLNEVRDVVAQAPEVARAICTLYRHFDTAKRAAQDMLERLYEGGAEAEFNDRFRSPSEEVSAVLQDASNHFAILEAGAERLWRDARLDNAGLRHGLVQWLENDLGIEVRSMPFHAGDRRVRKYDPKRRLLELSEVLAPRSANFQLAHVIGLITQEQVFQTLLDGARLSTDDARSLCRVALANYFAGAVLMPYTEFLASAKSERYDVELLGARFHTSYEQVCHRLTTLHRPGAQGVPFHLIRVDIAGNISKRFSASGIHFARFSGACPRWNVHAAFLTPGRIRTQVSEMPDGTVYFCFARTLRKGRGGWHAPTAVHAIGLGCELRHGRNLVYGDGIDLEDPKPVPVGVSCRICDRMDCAERAFAAVARPMRIDANVRGLSFYAPAER